MPGLQHDELWCIALVRPQIHHVHLLAPNVISAQHAWQERL